MKKTFLLFIATFQVAFLVAQCENWSKSPMKDELENTHVIYRQAMKAENYALAWDNWQKVFKAAPAADGTRDVQYFDGIELYKDKFLKATTDEAKEAAMKAALDLYDKVAACYLSGAIACPGEDCLNTKEGYIYGRKAYDMFYTFNSPYKENLEAINTSIKYGDIHDEYVIFAPAASIAVFQFENGLMEKADVVALYKKLNEIADWNINNNADLSSYYSQAKENMNGTFAKIEDQIFDCDYFKEKYQPEYESDPDNPDVIKKLIAILKYKECLATDEFLMQLEEKWSKYATGENARLKEEFEANNPASVARKLYDEGKYGAAIEKYEEAIDQEKNNDTKAQLLFGKASIQFRKLGQYGAARSTAYEAAKLKPNWGRPYMLIGDMYGKTASGCGSALNQRLVIIAAIDKYSYAKSIDGGVANEASGRINTYSRSLPDQEMGFMQGVKEGSSVNVGCWIGETVRVRYK